MPEKKRPQQPWLPPRLPWMPPWYDDSVIYAVRAVSEGVANEGQQKLFWRYLMYVTSASEEFADMTFRPEDMGGDRAMIFQEGKRFCGLMIRKLLRPELTPNRETETSQSSQPKRRRRPRNGNESKSD